MSRAPDKKYKPRKTLLFQSQDDFAFFASNLFSDIFKSCQLFKPACKLGCNHQIRDDKTEGKENSILFYLIRAALHTRA